jgi:Helicase associated domain
LRYFEQHGDARVSQSCNVGGYDLGGWVSHQRTKHAKGMLADRERRLGELRGWTWDSLADRWEGFKRLLDYVDCYGDARVPPSYTVDGYKLGKWVLKQRVKRVEGRLDVDRERRLEELRGWTWDPRADRWEEGFRRLLDTAVLLRRAPEAKWFDLLAKGRTGGGLKRGCLLGRRAGCGWSGPGFRQRVWRRTWLCRRG